MIRVHHAGVLALALGLLPLVSLGTALAQDGVPARQRDPSAPGETPDVRIVPTGARPGVPVLVEIRGGPPDLVAEWGERRLSLFRTRDGQAALVGVDLDAPIQSIPWRVSHRPAGRVLVRGRFAVRPFSYPTQALSLPRAQVDLDAATLARVRREQAELAAALAPWESERLWRGSFRVPVDGAEASGDFGLRRIINGQPRSPHTGFDWAAPRGTPVLAANAGRVALVAEHFFAGRLVVLDHGLGLFTLYFHLDDVGVRREQRVALGERLGGVGASGRATGPHLHFGVSLAGARVDPLALLELPIPPEAIDGTPEVPGRGVSRRP